MICSQRARVANRLPSNLSGEERALIEPLLPARSSLGRPATWTYRQIENDLFYVLRAGLPWRMLPLSEFPPMTTVQHYFYAWRDSGLWQILNHYLLMEVREACGKEASPTAGVIDSQSVKTTESGGARGFDTGKKINGLSSPRHRFERVAHKAPYHYRHQWRVGRWRYPRGRCSRP